MKYKNSRPKTLDDKYIQKAEPNKIAECIIDYEIKCNGFLLAAYGDKIELKKDIIKEIQENGVNTLLQTYRRDLYWSRYLKMEENHKKILKSLILILEGQV